jgi:preprotein translocase subunit SecF
VSIFRRGPGSNGEHGDDDVDLEDDDFDGSALDEVSQEDVEHLEEDIDTEDLDEEELVSLDDAARALLARPRRGHGPIARLYRGETRFDFVGRRKIWFAISTLIILLGIVSVIVRGGLNLGIEFRGGTEWTIAAPGVTQAEAVTAMQGTGLINPTVQLLGSGNKQTLTVQSDLNRLTQANQDQVSKNVQAAMLKLTAEHAPKTPPTTSTSHATTTTSHTTTTSGSATSTTAATTTTNPAHSVPATRADKISITTVGPTWGSSITNDAIKALIIFFIVVAIYISVRFEPKMAAAAFIAMIHDVLVAVGIYSIFNFQVTPDTVVAILTILGYSLYDTVVVFDRIRDNTRGIGSSGRMTYPQLVNLSMNQTLARSINTSAVAILPVLSVLLIGAQLLGADTLQSYGLALFVGLLSGAYSSIFIASPVLSMMKEREDRWKSIANRLAQRGERDATYSALDAATMGTQMSIAAAGQTGRGTGGGAAAPRSGSKRSGPIRPGSGARPSGTGTGTGGGAGAGTAVMDRPSGGSTNGGSGSGSTSTGAGSGGNASAPRPSTGPKPRKRSGKRRR